MKHKELFKLLDEVQEQGETPTQNRHDKVLLIDGLRVTNEKGWWLLRASNTQAALIVRAEGSSNVNLRALITEVKKYLIEAGLDIDLDKYF